MKLLTKFTPIAATLLVSLGAHAEESKLSVSGFIDMSTVYTSTDDDSSSVMGVDQVEIDFGYKVDDKLSTTLEVEYQENGVDVEQAFLSYAVSDAVSLKAGRFLSYSGFEAEEPTGLYQYSGTGYAPLFYGYYQQGVSASYSGSNYTLAISVVNDLAGPTATDTSIPGIETMVALMPTDEITVKGFYSVEGDKSFINLWSSYSKGALTLGAEFNSASDSETDTDSTGYLAMVNYAFDEKIGVTLRYHAYETEVADITTTDNSGITLAPSYTVSDNVLIVAEYRMDDMGGADKNTFALEALVTF
ncbi:porin [uncultured Psychrosphaera sp.]|jgi:hypothetical protein|uniref:porin n=1 Tax=uncultured Psychrosphaera sp. TaxID=1403522 RepID=UPI00261C7B9E|nr:porin [uncultured Psychrosphaera sp.]